MNRPKMLQRTANGPGSVLSALTTKIPQKKLTALGSFTANTINKPIAALPTVHAQHAQHSNTNTTSTANGPGRVQDEERKRESSKMDMDSDHSSDSDLDADDLAPLNLMAPGGKSLVKMKLEENRKRREDAKAKPKVDALHQAKLARAKEQREMAEKRRRKEETKKKIEENKKKRRREEQERKDREREGPLHRKKGNKPPLKAKGGQKRKLNSKKRNTIVGKENKGPPARGPKKALKPKRMVNVIKKPLQVNHGQTASTHSANTTNTASNQRKPLTVNNAKSAGKEEVATMRKEVAKPKKEKAVEYPISDYDSDFSDSDMDEEQCGKPIPKWAKKGEPAARVGRQTAIDPDTIFGRMDYKTCDLEILFKDYSSRIKYRTRSASGDWSKDLMSWAEENKYKKDMGWI